MSEKYLTTKEVSLLTGIPVETLKKMRMRPNTIPFLKVFKSVKYEYDDVIAWMNKQKITK